jgi:hypothetical protein
LVYLSQRCEPTGRHQLTLRRIARRLGSDTPAGVPDLPPKPPRMHWRTYERLADAYEAAEAREVAPLGAALGRCLRRHARARGA